MQANPSGALNEAILPVELVAYLAPAVWADRNAIGDGMPGQIRHRVVGVDSVERFAQIELFGVALQQALAFQQPPDPAGDGVGQLRELGRARLTYPLKTQAGTVGASS